MLMEYANGLSGMLMEYANGLMDRLCCPPPRKGVGSWGCGITSRPPVGSLRAPCVIQKCLVLLEQPIAILQPSWIILRTYGSLPSSVFVRVAEALECALDRSVRDAAKLDEFLPDITCADDMLSNVPQKNLANLSLLLRCQAARTPPSSSILTSIPVGILLEAFQDLIDRPDGARLAVLLLDSCCDVLRFHAHLSQTNDSAFSQRGEAGERTLLKLVLHFVQWLAGNTNVCRWATDCEKVCNSQCT